MIEDDCGDEFKSPLNDLFLQLLLILIPQTLLARCQLLIQQIEISLMANFRHKISPIIIDDTLDEPTQILLCSDNRIDLIKITLYLAPAFYQYFGVF